MLLRICELLVFVSRLCSVYLGWRSPLILSQLKILMFTEAVGFAMSVSFAIRALQNRRSLRSFGWSWISNCTWWGWTFVEWKSPLRWGFGGDVTSLALLSLSVAEFYGQSLRSCLYFETLHLPLDLHILPLDRWCRFVLQILLLFAARASVS